MCVLSLFPNVRCTGTTHKMALAKCLVCCFINLICLFLILEILTFCFIHFICRCCSPQYIWVFLGKLPNLHHSCHICNSREMIPTSRIYWAVICPSKSTSLLLLTQEGVAHRLKNCLLISALDHVTIWLILGW